MKIVDEIAKHMYDLECEEYPPPPQIKDLSDVNAEVERLLNGPVISPIDDDWLDRNREVLNAAYGMFLERMGGVKQAVQRLYSTSVASQLNDFEHYVRRTKWSEG